MNTKQKAQAMDLLDRISYRFGELRSIASDPILTSDDDVVIAIELKAWLARCTCDKPSR